MDDQTIRRNTATPGSSRGIALAFIAGFFLLTWKPTRPIAPSASTWAALPSCRRGACTARATPKPTFPRRSPWGRRPSDARAGAASDPRCWRCRHWPRPATRATTSRPSAPCARPSMAGTCGTPTRFHPTRRPCRPSRQAPSPSITTRIPSPPRAPRWTPCRRQRASWPRATAYRRYCSHCHGEHGDNRTIVGESFSPRLPDLRLPGTQAKTDRELYETAHARHRPHGTARRHAHAAGSRADHRPRAHPGRRAQPAALPAQVRPPDSVARDGRAGEGCRLCQAPLRKGAAADEAFCCAGCARVYAVIAGLDASAGAAYLAAARALGIVPKDGGSPPAPAAPQPTPSLPDDVEAVREERFRADGMFCPSCAWVIEKVVGCSGRGGRGALRLHDRHRRASL